MLASLVLALSLAPQGPATHVVINEFVYDDAGLDDEEFVELHNPTAATVDLSGFVLEQSSPAGVAARFTIPNGTRLGSGAFVVLGAPTVPGVTILLTRNGRASDLFDNGPGAALTLRRPSGVVIDRVDYRTYGVTPRPAGIEGDGLPGPCVATGASPHSYQRIVDGVDRDDNGSDFACLPRTPGLSNVRSAPPPGLLGFDATARGTPLADFAGSLARATVVDPAVLDADNPHVLPRSPQGGNAAVFAVGNVSGNLVGRLGTPLTDVVVECWAYVDASPPSHPTDAESWSIGVRGSSDSLGALPPVDVRLATVTGVPAGFWQPGSTGIAWVFQRTQRYAALHLVDWNDGGDDFRVLAVVPLTHGVDDGWVHLALRVLGDRVDARVGARQWSARTTTTWPGTVWIGWGESLLDDRDRRPPLLDALRIDALHGAVATVGTGTAHTLGSPQLDATTLAYPGSAAFALTATGLVPRGPVGVLTGFGLLTTPLDLAALGAPAGTRVFVRPDFSAGFAADAAGTLRIGLGVPTLPALVGGELDFQLIVPDPALPHPLPVATSAGLRIVVTD